MDTYVAQQNAGVPLHIIWDWNGTLLHDGAHMIASVSHAFEVNGLGKVSRQDHQRHFKRPIATFFRDLSGMQLSDTMIDDMMLHFQAHYDKRDVVDFMLPRTKELLTWLNMLGFSQSLLSMCPQSVLSADVDSMGLTSIFSSVDGHPGRGPDTKASHLASHLRRLGGQYETCLIGDTTDDFEAARAAGIRCVLVDRGHHSLQTHAQLVATGAPVVRCLRDAVTYAQAVEVACL